MLQHKCMPKICWEQLVHLHGGALLKSLVLVAILALSSVVTPRAVGETGKHNRVSGAGKTIIEGGTGGATPVPVTTLVAFHADEDGGDFECLALAPARANSGEFTENAMYVTGKVTSLEIHDGVAILHGNATVTGLGAGHDRSFVARVNSGGP